MVMMERKPIGFDALSNRTVSFSDPFGAPSWFAGNSCKQESRDDTEP